MLKNDALPNIVIPEFLQSAATINVSDVKFTDVVIYFSRESWWMHKYQGRR